MQKHLFHRTKPAALLAPAIVLKKAEASQHASEIVAQDQGSPLEPEPRGGSAGQIINRLDDDPNVTSWICEVGDRPRSAPRG
jgi:hypothetical protein